MSEHRRKPPQQPQGGGRAGARRAAQQPSGRRAAPPRGTTPASPSASYGEERPSGGRAEARRAAQRGGGGRRRVEETASAGHGGRGGGRRGGGGGGGGHEGPGRGRGGRPAKKRLIDYPRHDKYGWRRWVPSWKLVTGLFLGFMGSLMAAATIAYAMVEVPDVDKTAKAQNNVYYWADGSQMAATGGEINRQIIRIEKIPAAMQNAVISAENKTFKTDSGIDPMGISRALVNMAKGEQTQGGSTITQQYVKNARLGDQRQTLSRKFKELFISIRVGTTLEKKEIMHGYLNTSYYGRGAYGIQAAARTYYGTDAEKLNPSQCAFLATLLKGATYYDPAGATDIDTAATKEANRARAEKRWSWILGEMVKDGHLSAEERAKYKQFPMPLGLKKDAQLSGQVGYLVDLAKSYFLNNNDRDIDANKLAQGGYEIYTTFDKNKVRDLENAVKKVRKENINAKKRPDKDTHVQFGGASVEPETGKIVAIYGGEDATKHFTNNANETGAQVGSTFKPFVLAAAMRDGVRDPRLGPDQGEEDRKIVDPDKSRYNGKNKLKIKNWDGSVWRNEKGEEWHQRNDGDESYKNISLREAMIHSANSPFVQLGMDIGIPQVRQAAIDAGLLDAPSLSKANVPSFSIGISSPSAIRMAGAYGTFAAEGKQRDPYSVTKVKDGGQLVFEHEDKSERKFSSAIANNVTDVLRDVVDDPEGTGRNARLPGRQVAGKTGTTDGNKSAWFVGYTPQLSTAIDMYRLDDDEKSKKREFLEMYGTGGQDKIHGASFPSEIWQDYMEQALKDAEVMPFPDPEPIDGEAVFGGGLPSPTPTPSATPSQTPSEMPSSTPSETPSKSPGPKESCKEWEDWTCDTTGGTTGGDTGGDTTGGGVDSGGTTGGDTGDPTETPGTNGNGGGGNGNGGGLIGGSEN